MHLSFRVTAFILFAFATLQAHAQSNSLPVNPTPNLRSAESATLMHESIDSPDSTEPAAPLSAT
jgi:hypothetical protein